MGRRWHWYNPSPGPTTEHDDVGDFGTKTINFGKRQAAHENVDDPCALRTILRSELT